MKAGWTKRTKETTESTLPMNHRQKGGVSTCQLGEMNRWSEGTGIVGTYRSAKTSCFEPPEQQLQGGRLGVVPCKWRLGG
jgi:hypothetical protein